MLELLLNSTAATAPPSGIITGVVQNLGRIPGLPINTLSYRSDNRNGKIYFGQGGRDRSNTDNYKVYELDVLTKVVRVVGTDTFSSLAGGGGRYINITDDGLNLMLAGGSQTAPASAVLMNIASGAIVKKGVGGPLSNLGGASGGWGNRIVCIGGYNTRTILDYDFDTDTSTAWPGRLSSDTTTGYWSMQVGSKVYLKVRGGSTGFVVDLADRTVANYSPLLSTQAWSDPVRDDNGYWWFVIGPQTGTFTRICKYDLVTNTVLETITLTGDRPTNASFTGKDLHMCWHKGAIYLFHSDIDGGEGLNLYRII